MRLRMAVSLCCWPLLQPAAAAVEPPPPPVLRSVSAELLPASADGRFRVRADLRVEADLQSVDGRHRVKSTTASCDPNDLSLFRDGFEQQP